MINFLNVISEGGQTWAHRVRMLKQVTKFILFFSLIVSITSVFYQLFFRDFDLLIASWYWLKATVFESLGMSTIEAKNEYWSKFSTFRSAGATTTIPTKQAIQILNTKISILTSKLEQSLYFGIKVFGTCAMGFFVYFLFRGLKSKRKKHLSGKRIWNPTLLNLWLTIRRKASRFKIGPLSLVKGSETTHILITGGTGSGKTNCLHHILKSIRSKGQKTVVIDTTGAFIDRYFRQGKDHILNPFDDRGVKWSPWSECSSKQDYDIIAESFIPPSYNDHESYWRTAARSLFSALLQKLEPIKKNTDIVRWTLYESLQDLCSFVEGTKAASHMDIQSEKTAGSVRSVASSFLECFDYLDDVADPFSIKKWIEKEDDSWIFISCKPSERAAITPLLTSYISLAVNAVINLCPSSKRRIWFVLDELPTLNKVKGLETLLTEGRKYGACALIALQSPAQLEAIYGREGARIISGQCATKVVFAEYDAETAERISKLFGQKKVGECQEGISYGANDMRDGVSLSYQIKNESTVSATDIQSLVPNQAFVKLPGRFPITKLKLKIA